MKVLLADDEPTQRYLLEKLLKGWGHEPLTARNGDEAWAALSSDHPPLLAILDWMMPGMDGLNICRKLRKRSNQPYVYVILITAKHQKQDLVEALDAGADDFLTKPFDSQEFRARIQTGIRILRLQEQLVTASTHDSLTGLLNRVGVLDAFRKELLRAQRQKQPLAAILADLDHFKNINDTHGHQMGDAVLQRAAQSILESVRSYDSVGRYGGEEFLVVLPGCDFPAARERAEVIRSRVSERSDAHVHVTLSMGVAVNRNMFNPDQILRAADLALYRAKANGRDRIESATDVLLC
jgi:two-component system cell cycle response regulator